MSYEARKKARRREGKDRKIANRFRGVPIAAVIDSCVLLDGFSAHDLFWAHELNPGQPDAPNVRKRRMRARDALLLVECLNQRNEKCIIAAAEWASLLPRRVPSDPTKYPHCYPDFYRDVAPPLGDEFPTAYIKVFSTDMMPHLFPNFAAYGDFTDEGRTGSECDAYLVDQAQRRGAPLITAEEGTGPRDIRGRAAQACVEVIRPREYWQRHLDEDDGIEALLARWRGLRPQAQRFTKARYPNYGHAEFVLKHVDFYLHHVLCDVGVEAHH
jgi:hypothetical protein